MKYLKPIIMPKTYNYIAVFLTFACNLNCDYCINKYEGTNFPKGVISGKQWVDAINRIKTRPDIPVTLQGGEPSLHPDFIYIINNLRKDIPIDILTNLQFDLERFISEVKPERVRRTAPYASIRVSYHPQTMNLDDTIKKTLLMLKAGFHIGLFGVLHPIQKKQVLDAQKKCKALGIDFRTKEFLGEHEGRLYGAYKYPDAVNKKTMKKMMCKITELIIGPNGSVYKCHSDLYENRKPIGNIIDPNYIINDEFKYCEYFGHCNPCDIKVKTNRLQKFGYTAAEIKEALKLKKYRSKSYV